MLIDTKVSNQKAQEKIIKHRNATTVTSTTQAASIGWYHDSLGEWAPR